MFHICVIVCVFVIVEGIIVIKEYKKPTDTRVSLVTMILGSFSL